MRVLLFGATGMVGQGVLRECLLDASVSEVLAIGRSVSGQQYSKLTELEHANLLNYSLIEDRLTDFQACFFCLGVSSGNMSEEAYRRVTFDITLCAAETLVRLNPLMTFIYVSGAGTNSSEQSGPMWARVKGRTENALLRLPFKDAYMFRPGLIRPMHGVRSRTKSYRVLYSLLSPVLPAIEFLLPQYVTSTEKIGLAMIQVVKQGTPKKILEAHDLHVLLRH